jgi:predicted transcriptional regulator
MPLNFIDTKKLSKRISELKEELEHLLHLESFATKKTKRGPKPVLVKAKPASGKTVKRGKRGGLKAAVLEYLKSGPQPIKSIVIATKGNYASVAQTLNNLKKAKLVTKDSKRGGAYALVK